MLTRSPVTPRKVGADANASTPSAKGTPTRTSKTWLFNLSKSKAAKEKQEEAKNKELRSSVVRRSATQRVGCPSFYSDETHKANEDI